ncbi:MAG: ABC transporter permease, partial [Firmicutes bacterium]|nr:ABC transporter permease [Bacillota bacterium]
MKKLSSVYLVLLFGFLYAPLLVMIMISFNGGESTAHMTGVSLRWYREMFKDAATLQAFKNTLTLSLSSAAISTVLGTLAAVGIDRMRSQRLKAAVMSVTNIPMMNPDIVTGISLMLLFVFAASLFGFS